VEEIGSMNITCPDCQTIYRVDPRKVPSGGIRVRCGRCPAEFDVAIERARSQDGWVAPATSSPPAADEAEPDRAYPAVAGEAEPDQGYPDEEGEAEPDRAYPAVAGEAEPDQGYPDEEGEAEPDHAYSPAAGEAEPDHASVAGEAGAAPAAWGPTTSEEPAAAANSELPATPFTSTDPHTRARRLARALVSDIVVYNPERRDRSLQQGTIRQDFREEIHKSWDEYVTQVGNEMARGTSYFQDALNEVLAGGSRLF
jgi:predicted Zn finger-like uncharacterized protein